VSGPRFRPPGSKNDNHSTDLLKLIIKSFSAVLTKWPPGSPSRAGTFSYDPREVNGLNKILNSYLHFELSARFAWKSSFIIIIIIIID
jgi:hypothetical protein